MFEKIFQKLKDNRAANSNVSDRTLETLARSLSTLITTDEQLTLYDAKTAIESMDGNIRASASNAIKKADEQRSKEAEEKKKADEKKKVEAAVNSLKTPNTEGEGTEKIPTYVQAILEQNKLLVEGLQQVQSELSGINAKNIKSNRQDKLNKVLNGIPDYIANPIKNSFKAASFENEDSFSEYLSGVEKDATTFKDAAKIQGLNTDSPSKDVQKPVVNGETPSLKGARDIVNKQKEKQNATNSK